MTIAAEPPLRREVRSNTFGGSTPTEEARLRPEDDDFPNDHDVKMEREASGTSERQLSGSAPPPIRLPSKHNEVAGSAGAAGAEGDEEDGSVSEKPPSPLEATKHPEGRPFVYAPPGTTGRKRSLEVRERQREAFRKLDELLKEAQIRGTLGSGGAAIYNRRRKSPTRTLPPIKFDPEELRVCRSPYGSQEGSGGGEDVDDVVRIPLPAAEDLVDEEPPFNSREQTVILFDWDDTLFPTSWICTHPVLTWGSEVPEDRADIKEELGRMAAHTIETLRAAERVGRIAVVTLSLRPWVKTSSQRFLPGVWETMKELGIRVVYAREALSRKQVQYLGEEDGVDVLVEMKRVAMYRTIRKHYRQAARDRAAAEAGVPTDTAWRDEDSPQGQSAPNSPLSPGVWPPNGSPSAGRPPLRKGGPGGWSDNSLASEQSGNDSESSSRNSPKSPTNWSPKQAGWMEGGRRPSLSRSSHSPHWRNVLSVGDSIVERDALKELIFTHETQVTSPTSESKNNNVPVPGCRCKTVKLMEDPDVLQLCEQLSVVAAWVEAMVNYDDDFDANVEDEENSLLLVYSRIAQLGKRDGDAE